MTPADRDCVASPRAHPAIDATFAPNIEGSGPTTDEWRQRHSVRDPNMSVEICPAKAHTRSDGIDR
jgi:hypothetical protein